MLRRPFVPAQSTNAWSQRAGKIRYGLAAWLIGLPLPLIIIALFIRGCDW